MVRAKTFPSMFTRKRQKILHLAKGFRGRRKNCYSVAVRAVHKALTHSYRGRKLKKGDMRQMWITRIGIATKEHGLTYGLFMHYLQTCNIQLNRKVLSELALTEPRSFQALTELALKRRSEGLLGAMMTPERSRDLIIKPRMKKPAAEPQKTPYLESSV